MRISQNSFPIFFLPLFLPFFSPFLFSLSSTFYPLPIHWKSLGLSSSKNQEMEHWSTIGDLTYFTTNFCTQNWTRFPGTALPEFGRYWKLTRMDGSILAVLAAYQNNLVTSKTMTSQVVQCLLLQMSRKVDFRSESVKGRTIRKVGGGVGNFWAARIFFVNISLAGIFFFRMPEPFFLGYSREFFYSQFSLAWIFFVLQTPPPPITFLMVRPKFTRTRMIT